MDVVFPSEIGEFCFFRGGKKKTNKQAKTGPARGRKNEQILS